MKPSNMIFVTLLVTLLDEVLSIAIDNGVTRAICFFF